MKYRKIKEEEFLCLPLSDTDIEIMHPSLLHIYRMPIEVYSKEKLKIAQSIIIKVHLSKVKEIIYTDVFKQY